MKGDSIFGVIGKLFDMKKEELKFIKKCFISARLQLQGELT